ncbi:MAG: TAXI family TRAP transporter solute-binding subunit [Methyloligellaceae bacterium]
MRARNFLSIMLALVAVSILVLWYVWERQEYSLTIAAGQSSGQAFQLVKAIQTVTHRHHPELKIEVFETRGSLQNARLLETGSVDMATTRSDLVFGNRGQLVADLYSDAFQLVVRRDSGIKHIADLIGRRIALPPEKSSAHESFWFVASHYAVEPKDIEAYPGTEATTDWLLINGDVDALFRVRAPGDESIDKLIRQADAQVIAIPQAPALKLKRPALESGVIPQGSYKGRPTVPDEDIMTVAVKRLLLARKELPDEAVSRLTSILFERRRELIDLVPLSGSIAIPDRSSGTFLPLHAGAGAYYDRNEPTFLQENAEPIALLVSVLVILASVYLQLSALRRRRALGSYNQELLALAQKARGAHDFETIDDCHDQLSRFVNRIVEAAGDGDINAQEFNLFNFTYEAVEDAIRDREHQLEREQLGSEREGTGSPAPDSRRRKRAKSAAEGLSG